MGHDKKLASNWIASRKFLQILQQALIKVRNEGFITIRRFFFLFFVNYVGKFAKTTSRHEYKLFQICSTSNVNNRDISLAEYVD